MDPFPSPRKPRDARRLRRIAARLLFATLGALATGGLLFAALWLLYPFPAADLLRPRASTRILAEDGTELALTLGEGDQVRLPVRLAEVSGWFAKAIVAAEDRRFRSHFGVDPFAVARALGQDLWRGERFSGASTITMQVIRRMEGRPRTLATKLYEAFRALQLERLLSKSEILEEYVNRAPFGRNLVGVAAAARRFFGVAASDLTLGQSALLAGLVQAPGRLDPIRRPEPARARRRYVLARMRADGFVSDGEAALADAEPLPNRLQPSPFLAPHFTRRVITRGAVEPEARTTLRPRLQALAELHLRARVAELRGEGVESGAAIVVENDGAAVRALVGSPDFFGRRGQVDGTAAERSPGSSLKPFLYAQAIDEGRLTPATALFDVPGAWREYAPANYAPRFQGPLPASEALRQSLNLPAVRLLADVGVSSWAGTLGRLELFEPGSAAAVARRHGLGLALGSCGVTLADAAAAYATLARGGEHLPLRWLAAGTAGETPPRRVFSREACWMVLSMLSREPLPDAAPEGTRPGPSPVAAWKTGTSHGLRDAWVFAVTPRWTVGVWLGNASGRPSPALVGRQAAAPIAGRILRDLAALEEASSPASREFARPAGVRTRTVCMASGARASPHCPSRTEDVFIPGVSSAVVCSVHAAVTVDATTGAAVCRACRHGRATREVVVERWPADVEAWLRASGATGAARIPHDPACPSNGRDRRALAVLSPPDGQAYRLLADTPDLSQRVPLRAGGARGAVWWFVDGRLFGSGAAGDALYWPLAAGEHLIECVDAGGDRGASRVRVASEAAGR
ncbi:MAG: penicillin-binding protein 1C [Planctomycetes bacterium]|nr:penicillin-binding protein 1C [Planctomycetota bacterium]